VSAGAGRPRLLVATANPGKVRELAEILADLPVHLVGLGDLDGEPPQVEETGATFRENARLKARAYATWSGLPALADDSGLEVDALGGAPGVHSARYAGEGASDADNLAKLLAELESVPDDKRAARFRCAAFLSDPAVGEWHAEAAWDGQVISTPRGDGGFGYDPIFVPTGWQRTSAEVDAATKNAVSHRSRAFRALRPAIERWAARHEAAR
jgi:XTP/dITP diphosphohydrolase